MSGQPDPQSPEAFARSLRARALIEACSGRATGSACPGAGRARSEAPAARRGRRVGAAQM
eukprot:492771-Prymnesium_polylepis.2